MRCPHHLEVIRLDVYTYRKADQKSVLAPAKRLTGGFNGAFSFEAHEYRVLIAATTSCQVQLPVSYRIQLPVGQFNSVT